MNLRELFVNAYSYKQKHPNLRNEIDSFLDLAVMEIEDGEPESIECEKAWDDIIILVKQ